MQSQQIKLSCRNVWKIYGDNPEKFFNNQITKLSDPLKYAKEIQQENHIVANADVSFDVHVGEIFVIMGLSGSGKSTIVRCLSRLVEPSAGEIFLDNEDLLKKTPQELTEIRRHKMGMVFQSFGLIPHLNVIDNIAFPLRIQNVEKDLRYERAKKVIELVGLDGREENFPSELSGGQQQRVGIARSLVVEPDVWFLDEPFSALDPLIRRQMQDEFMRIQSVLHKSIVFITHDFVEALRIADRMAIMRDGHIVQFGRPIDIVMNPIDDYVRDFTGDVPFERFLKAGDIVENATGNINSLKRISVETPLKEILPLLATQSKGLAVENKDGKLLGVTTPQGVIKVMASAGLDNNK
tara:strand:+ start:650 stop:1705 length:1056 start_codon:yes stop_codon:yes gene_type:complete